MPQVALFASEDIEAFTELCFGALAIRRRTSVFGPGD